MVRVLQGASASESEVTSPIRQSRATHRCGRGKAAVFVQLFRSLLPAAEGAPRPGRLQKYISYIRSLA